MIQVYQNITNDSESDEFISFYKNNYSKIVTDVSNNLYHFNYVDIIDNYLNFRLTKNIRKSNISKLRVQHIDKSVQAVEVPHGHTVSFSFVVFLNDDFKGGELLFDNIVVTPKKNQMVCFSGDEMHYVKPVIDGDRYTLVGFLKNEVKFNEYKIL